MTHHPDSNILKNIASVEQLVSSYYVAEAIQNIRANKEEEVINKAIVTLHNSPPSVVLLFDQFCKMINYNPGFVYAAKIGLEDCVNYGFEKDPSVVATAQKDASHLKMKFQQNWTQLSKVTLMDHTISVFKSGLNEGMQQGRSLQVALPVLGCLFHDFGKSSKIREEIIGTQADGGGYRPHAEISAEYIRAILSKKMHEIDPNMGSHDMIESLASIVASHHPNSKKEQSDSSIMFVNNHDMLSRSNEMREIRLKAKG